MKRKKYFGLSPRKIREERSLCREMFMKVQLSLYSESQGKCASQTMRCVKHTLECVNVASNVIPINAKEQYLFTHSFHERTALK